MARNVEIKARARDFQRQFALAKDLADGPATLLPQRDIFYHVPQGRMKLRFEGSDKGYLVSYSRPDKSGPKLSNYQLFPTQEPTVLDQCLRATLEVRGEVVKERTLFMVGQTRIHMDVVQGLGEYMELEVVLRESQSAEEGQAIAEDLMNRLDIHSEDLITDAYMDMLEQGRS